MKIGIALFVYNRPEHTARVLEGLKANHIRKLTVFSDGPRREGEREKVEAVRSLVKKIDWCEKELVFSKENKGLSRSIKEGVDALLLKNEAVIVVEDDCLPGPEFVSFMRSCLEFYQNKREVMSVTGYKIPVTLPQDYSGEIFFSHRPWPWGWATWRRAWRLFHDDLKVLDQIKHNGGLKEKMKKYGEDLLLVLELQKKGLFDSWYVFWATQIILNEGVCINPVRSYIKNIGLDGSGEHCRSYSEYETELTHEKGDVSLPGQISFDERIVRSCRNLYQLNWFGKLKSLFIKFPFSSPLYRFARKSSQNFSRAWKSVKKRGERE